MCCQHLEKMWCQRTSLRPRQDRNITRMVSAVILWHPFKFSCSRSSKHERAAKPTLVWVKNWLNVKQPEWLHINALTNSSRVPPFIQLGTLSSMHLMNLIHLHAPNAHPPYALHASMNCGCGVVPPLTCICQLFYIFKVKITDLRTALGKLLDALVCIPPFMCMQDVYRSVWVWKRTESERNILILTKNKHNHRHTHTYIYIWIYKRTHIHIDKTNQKCDKVRKNPSQQATCNTLWVREWVRVECLIVSACVWYVHLCIKVELYPPILPVLHR